LELGISLDTCKTLLKYVRSLHSYLQHTLLIFNPDDLMKCLFKPYILNQVADHSRFHHNHPKSWKSRIPTIVKGRTIRREKNQKQLKRKYLLVLIAIESVMMNLGVENIIPNLSPKSSLKRRMKRKKLQ